MESSDKYRPYAYDATPSMKRKGAAAWGSNFSIGLYVKAVVRKVPVAHVQVAQDDGFDRAMTSIYT